MGGLKLPAVFCGKSFFGKWGLLCFGVIWPRVVLQAGVSCNWLNKATQFVDLRNTEAVVGNSGGGDAADGTSGGGDGDGGGSDGGGSTEGS